MKIITLQAAKAAGQTRYFTGYPCKNGHIAERLVSSRSCVTCANFKLKQYAQNNRKDYLEKAAERAKNYRKNHKDKARESRKVWASRNREKDNAYSRKWRVSNKTVVAALCRRRHASKLKRTPKWIGSEEHWLMREAYELAALRSKMTGVKWHVDHIIPLQGRLVSGLHVPTNLRVIPAVENVRKGNRFEVIA